MQTSLPETDSNRQKTNAPLVERKYLVPFILVTSLFFMWVFAHNLNDILIRQFQKALALSRGEASFVQVAFYIGYFVTALPAGYAMQRIGYKNGMLVGLGLFAVGALLFYPAAEVRSYSFFLVALFVIAAGATFLETAANPYVTALGSPETAAQRLNLAQSFNGLGGVVAPIVGGLFVFSGVEHSAVELAAMPDAALEMYRQSEADAVQIPYLVLAFAVSLIALLIFIVRFPTIEGESDHSEKNLGFRGIFQHKHLIFAVVAQLLYVAAQVGIWSYFIDFVKDMMPDTTEKTAANWLALSIFFFMAGRFIGTFLMRIVKPHYLLAAYAFANIILCFLAITSEGLFAVICYGALSFFMSIMFPTIFALGVRDLGGYTKLGSSLLIMAIVGGALCPPLMGYIADYSSLQPALYVPLFCFVFVGLFALFSAKTR